MDGVLSMRENTESKMGVLSLVWGDPMKCEFCKLTLYGGWYTPQGLSVLKFKLCKSCALNLDEDLKFAPHRIGRKS